MALSTLAEKSAGVAGKTSEPAAQLAVHQQDNDKSAKKLAPSGGSEKSEAAMEETPKAKRQKLAEDLLKKNVQKKGTYFSPGKKKATLAIGLKEEAEKISEERGKAHALLHELRARDKKVRRVQAKVAKTCRKMTVAEIVAAASMKGMSLEDFKALAAEEAKNEPQQSSSSSKSSK